MGGLNVANIGISKDTNGPWRRVVTHFQGCTLACKGCFNPHLWSKKPAQVFTSIGLARKLYQMGLQHYTFSGGEPFQQGDAFYRTLRFLRMKTHTCTIMVFTGYSLSELDDLLGEDACEILGYIDVLVSGRYDVSKAMTFGQGGYASSSNQVVIRLSRRISEEALNTTAPGVEILIDPEGGAVMTGFPPENVLKRFEEIIATA